MYVDGAGMFMMAWMGVLTVGFIATAIVAWLVRSGLARPAQDSGVIEAESVLRNRYAAGEIDDDEFLRRLAVLRGQHRGQW